MFRRYSRSQARFEQADPYDGSYDLSDPQSLNRYSYTQNDPVNFTDPTGLTMSAQGCGAEYSLGQCGGAGGFWGGGEFGGHIADDNRLFAGMPGRLVGAVREHEERANNDRHGHGYQTNAEVNRGRADFFIYYLLCEDGSLWTDFNIFTDVSGGSRAHELAREMNRRPIGRTFVVLYGGSVAAGTGAGAALYAAGGGGGSAALGLSTVRPGEFAVIGQLPSTANFLGMSNVNVLSVSSWSQATQAAWIQRMVSMRMPFLVAGGPTVNRAGGAYAVRVRIAADICGRLQEGRLVAAPSLATLIWGEVNHGKFRGASA